ncbi:sucrose nonfermenting 4-like protein [Humulus lupulus]|uniref:sucrose nonfermenting 4-like protein n=1 Tax=Humulus lupulus TaxID=3486 RepID=UPI002B40AE04|nr:sucrose nonfermenting 4-like protein [Humulus lupulus]
MFVSGPNTGHESGGGGVSGSVLIPTLFMWRYGGRSVLLCGSFTRWADNIPLSPVEGSSTLFQVVWNLTPGYHQYKFNVDGEWRHDENEPIANSDYGIVNTITVSTESDMALTGASSEAPGSMDVDNEFFMPVIPSLSKDDVEVSRYRIFMFLTTNTAYNLLPESGKVVALDINLPVKQAFHILYEQGIPVAPLWDFSKGQFVAVLTALDFILILRELRRHGPNLAEEELETHTIAAWKERKASLSIPTQVNGESCTRNLIQAGPYDSLKEVALKILNYNVATVPIVQPSSQDGSFPQLLHLASLSGILKCICRHFRHASSSLPILQQPICAIPVGTWVPKIGEPSGRPFAMLKLNASLSDALSLLVQAEVSSVPIVDDNNSLLDIYSRSDITALAKDRTYAQISLDEMSIQQALQLGQDVNSPRGFFNGQRCQMCLRSDTLHKVMERLANPGVRRLVIVEAGSKRVEGIISLSDVFRFLLGVKA